ncbi:ketopantoate reductase family protein [Pseudonocardia nantongensis]|uniref:ketopantoate reductase family protein n=1 Tax=Pseudonocardia nantongensis TaxID=1181885 RepID=UPI003978590C
MSRPYTVVGAGAIGGTLAAHLYRAGHPVQVADADAGHVAAIRDGGLRLRHPDGTTTVATLPAGTPDDPPAGELGPVLLAVKAQTTGAALDWIAPRLPSDGWVVSLQNGLNEERIAARIGADRTVGAFVNLFADVAEPGVITDGGRGALVIGETDGRPSDRVQRLVADLQCWGPAASTTNVTGHLWSKLAFGAMLTATALADAPMAELIDRHRGVMHALAREVLAVASAHGVRPEPFDAWDPAPFLPGATGAEAATDRLTAWLAAMPKDRSGIWRDIAVRRRPVEVHDHYGPVLACAGRNGVAVPVLNGVLARLAEVESGRVPMSEEHLAVLGREGVA